MKRIVAALSLAALTVALAGCASFVNSSQKSLYVASTLADGAMKTYATYWKDETNRLGDTPALESQYNSASAISFKVGASLNVANRALNDYAANAGTNTATKAVVEALITTAIQNAGSIEGEISVLTGDPSWAVSVAKP